MINVLNWIIFPLSINLCNYYSESVVDRVNVVRAVMKLTSIHDLFLNIAMLTSFVPNTNIVKGELLKLVFFNSYSAFLCIGMSLFQFHSIFTSVGEDIVESWIVFCTAFISIRSIYVKRETWKKWITLYKKTNKHMKCKMGEHLELGWKYIWIYLAYNACFILFKSYSQNESTEYRIYVRNITRFMLLAALYLSIIFLMILLLGFKILNKYSRNLNIESGLQLNIIAKMNSNKAVYYKNLFRNLYEMSDSFNDIFGLLLTTFFL